MACADCREDKPPWIMREPDYRLDPELHPEIFITPFPDAEKEVHDGFVRSFEPEVPAIAPDDVES